MANTVEHTGRTAVTRRSALFTRRTHVHSVRSLSIYKQAVVEISVSSLHTRCSLRAASRRPYGSDGLCAVISEEMSTFYSSFRSRSVGRSVRDLFGRPIWSFG